MDIHRLPTRAETIVGALAALVLSSALGFVLWVVLREVLRRPEILGSVHLTVLVVLAVIFVWSVALLGRILFGSPALPGRKGQIGLGWLMVAAGGFLCFAPLFPLFPWFRGSVVHSLGQGIVGIALGLGWASRARKRNRR